MRYNSANGGDTVKNPLRYPGGKTKLVDYIGSLISDNKSSGRLSDNCTIVEPYAGSAAISLALLDRNIVEKAILVELDPLIYAFWHSVFNNNDQLLQLIDTTDINIDTWHLLQDCKAVDAVSNYSLIELGFAGLFFNRTNFSGILNANPIGGLNQTSAYSIDCRFKKNVLIKNISALATLADRVTLVHSDAIGYLRTTLASLDPLETFLYVDPPYFEKGKQLYRHWHSKDEHVSLHSLLINTNIPWLVSYDNHQFIRELYSNNNIDQKQTYFDYTVRSHNKNQLELLFSNLKIPPNDYILDLEA